MKVRAVDPIARQVNSVYVDGVDVTKRCFEADDEAGYVCLYKVDERGIPLRDIEREELATETIHGRVIIVFNRDSPS
jgi:hypothetical protein